MGKRTKRYTWAVLAIDPGGVTGVAEAYVPRRGSIAEALRDARVRTFEVKGNHVAQCITLGLCYKSLKLQAEKFKIEHNRIVIPIESFQLRQRNVDLAPVRVQSCLEGMLVKYPTNFQEQTPANAKAFATNDRLRKWGLYEPGSEHCRDAARHLALYLARQF